jgi:hypothetical protein
LVVVGADATFDKGDIDVGWNGVLGVDDRIGVDEFDIFEEVEEDNTGVE